MRQSARQAKQKSDFVWFPRVKASYSACLCTPALPVLWNFSPSQLHELISDQTAHRYCWNSTKFTRRLSAFAEASGFSQQPSQGRAGLLYRSVREDAWRATHGGWSSPNTLFVNSTRVAAAELSETDGRTVGGRAEGGRADA